MSGSEYLTDEEAIRRRAEEALRELPLSDSDITKAVPGISADVAFLGTISANSNYWDFKDKAEAVVAHFAADGLTLEDYLHAAAMRPQVFSQDPQKTQDNIEGVVGHFADDGLAIADYLKTALRVPALFCASPATVIRKVHQLTHMFERGLVPSPEGESELVTAITYRPTLLLLSESNLTLRATYAAMDNSGKLEPLYRTRAWIERAVAELLGHGDLRVPVEKVEEVPGTRVYVTTLGRNEHKPVVKVEETPGNRVKHAKSTVLRALIRQGVIGRGSLAD